MEFAYTPGKQSNNHKKSICPERENQTKEYHVIVGVKETLRNIANSPRSR